ncbi:MAG: energy transducer TonB [Chitinophagaceae bacterium]|nr:MAG: energy transducer TonB [Chitinophagaceae bacterium]
MEANKILSADILDLVFEGRNKAYGAYELRSTYHKRIRTALIVMASIFLLTIVGAFVSKKLDESAPVLDVKDVELAKVEEAPPPKPEPPPPPPPKTEPPPKVEMTKFTPPKIVPDEQVKKEDIPPEVEKLEDTKIDVVSQEGVKQDIAVPPVDEGKAVVAVPKDETNYDQTFTKVENEAEFPGGQKAWIAYLQRTLQPPSDAPAGTYTIKVQFIVDKEGNISDVKALNDPGYGMGDEAIRAIKRGPKWQPAVQNGRQVKAYRTQPITFVISE